MLLEDLLWLILSVVVARAVWRLADGVMDGLNGSRSSATRRGSGGGVPARGVQMVRDPVCGTYVVPDRAVPLTDRSGNVFFCSAACRDTYRSQGRVEGRTA